MKIYSHLSNEFRLLDYSPSHSQLLIRSMRTKNREYNIDIVFKGVLAMLVTDRINGIEISLSVPNTDNTFLTRDFGFKQNKEDKIFLLKTIEGQIFYINADSFGVYHNKLDILETSIGRYDIENLGENVLWFAE